MPLPNGTRSSGDADRASNKRFAIGTTILIAIIALLCYTSVIPNDLNRFFAVTKSGTKWLGLLSFAIALSMVYGAHNAAMGEKSGASYWIAVLVFLALGIGIACGFDFSYLRLR